MPSLVSHVFLRSPLSELFAPLLKNIKLLQANYSKDIDKMRTGVCIGNSMVDLDFIAESHNLVTSGKGKRVTPYFVPRVLGNMAAAIIAIQHGFRGPNHAVSTACSTGLHAIGHVGHYRLFPCINPPFSERHSNTPIHKCHLTVRTF